MNFFAISVENSKVKDGYVLRSRLFFSQPLEINQKVPRQNLDKYSTAGPRYSQNFYLRICLFTFQKWFKMTILQSKVAFLSANSRIVVQNNGKYLPQITREPVLE
jgi:hypothetical protein